MCLLLAKESRRNITCSDRVAMTLAPCLYLDDPLAYTDCCVLQHENKNDLNLHIPPLIECGGTILDLSNPVNTYWIFFRCAITLYLLGVLIFNAFIYITYYEIYFMFIYFTHWSVMISIAYIITSTICSYKIYQKYRSNNNQISRNDIVSLQYSFTSDAMNEDKLSGLYTINKILLQICIPSLSLITFNFWVLAQEIPVSDKRPQNELEVIAAHQLYGYVLIMIICDFIFSGQKLYYKSFFWSILFFTIWTIFSILYDMNGAGNEYGQPFIFETVDWSQQTMIPMIKYWYSIMMLILFNSLFTFGKNLILITKIQKINSYIPTNDFESDDSELDQILNL